MRLSAEVLLRIVPPMDFLTKTCTSYFTCRGAACEVAGKQVRRSAEVRTACSPDAATHLAVHEPSACRYVAVLHSPALCGMPGFKPTWAGAAAPGASNNKTCVSGGRNLAL